MDLTKMSEGLAERTWDLVKKDGVSVSATALPEKWWVSGYLP